MSDDPHGFEQFMKRREDVARAYAQGNADPLPRIAAQTSMATFFGPNGGYQQGAAEVLSTYEGGAKLFEAGGDSSFEIFQIAASGEVAFWTGIQRATVRMRGSAETVPMDLRVTEVFRREDDEWKLVHRHADTQVSESNYKR